MKQLFSIRSPFWTCIFILLFFIVTGYMLLEDNFNIDAPWRLAMAGVVLLLCLVYIFAIYRHNVKNPNYPIKYLGIPELKDEDEGMRMFTARATYRVYIFHSFALPLAAIIYVLMQPPAIIVLAMFALLALGQVIVYWVSMWPVYSNRE